VNDKETLLEMLTRAGIPVDHGTGPGDHSGFTITVDKNKVTGYTAFFTTIHFDGDGNLYKIGVWEG
jgi:hypothetical protein